MTCWRAYTATPTPASKSYCLTAGNPQTRHELLGTRPQSGWEDRTLTLLTRIPAMVKAKVVLDPKVPPKELTSKLPPSVRWVADNYNHLMEAPTLFYAAAIVVALACPTNGTAIAAAWAYVALRVLHSLVQALLNHIPTRLALFVMSTVALGVLVWQGAWAVFGI